MTVRQCAAVYVRQCMCNTIYNLRCRFCSLLRGFGSAAAGGDSEDDATATAHALMGTGAAVVATLETPDFTSESPSFTPETPPFTSLETARLVKHVAAASSRLLASGGAASAAWHALGWDGVAAGLC
jgi:hypothetical protein